MGHPLGLSATTRVSWSLLPRAPWKRMHAPRPLPSLAHLPLDAACYTGWSPGPHPCPVPIPTSLMAGLGFSFWELRRET